MGMTRKDFEAVASIIDSELSMKMVNGTEEALVNVATRFADVAQRSNPLFDRARFYEACGVDADIIAALMH